MKDSVDCPSILPTDRTSVLSETSTLVGSSSHVYSRHAPMNSYHNSMNSNIYHSPKASSPLVSYKTSSPVLLKRATAPVLPSFKPKEQRYNKPQGCSLITAVELGKIIETLPDEKVLLLDVRPFTEHAKSIITNSIHVCLPSTLLRRKNFTFSKLLDNLTPSEQSVLKSKLAIDNLRIIIYDSTANQTESSVSLPCYGIASKLIEFDTNVKKTVSILMCGFPQFKILFPDHINTNTFNSDCISSAEPKSPKTNLMNSLHNTAPHMTATTPLSSPQMNLKLKVPDDSRSDHSNFSSSPSPRNVLSDSPMSSSSPISALFKFQLPAPQTNINQMFKFSQNEEIMDLETYLSAVNIKEEHERWYNNDSAKKSLQNFQFPKNQNSLEKDTNKDKLGFQIRYENLSKNYENEVIDSVIPEWFQHLMSIPKIELVSQFQKLDFLEKRRLNHSVSFRKKENSFILEKPSSYPEQLTSTSSSTIMPPKFPDVNKVQKRSHSQPIFTQYSKYKSMLSLESDSDSEPDDVIISSGVELGAKNRYKDIFPYEHSRVILKKGLQSSKGIKHSHSTSDGGILDNYINANYLSLPRFSVEQNSSFQTTTTTTRRVRYIATQAPMPSTVHDFYTCILNNGVPLVLSLTNDFENGIEKCYRYWQEGNYNGIHVKLLEKKILKMPSTTSMRKNTMGTQNSSLYSAGVQGNSSNYSTDNDNDNDNNNNNNNNSNIAVTAAACDDDDDDDDDAILIRKILLTYHDQEKPYELLQIQVKNWPDLGTLLNPISILQAINVKNHIIDTLFARNYYQNDQLPTILVHCSAGCGRTGTLCTIDSILSNFEMFEMLQKEFVKLKYPAKLFDPISWTINIFRKQRISMVQNINQFIFIYDCLLFYFRLRLDDITERTDGDGSNKDNISLSALIEQIEKLEILQTFVDDKLKELPQ
ncbi:ADI_G0016580.mRNA.1.CDS.1 [Saccharomyces cerevisiae]|nr:Ptp3p [Saccharomyces cerevisiae YJM993]AJU40292.1 Ptp3p [Saccharomyces cerevisiae YJM969]AJU40548.1 Ptp3p [Saccharomyces cerevisiae YJM972]AJU40808.1 Ptp3p [Saccharomyces cerevisiae YJM975]AJU41066.1 Ptp3p [Saccharomyces cerevisiae YJM978]AJU41293.1 Ptp3p [Saccharomyces cerevisiae YJM981]AJU41547.1 Ptp3p [Saccharomyces cerevisiae YJM984]AJU41802.1 Ptp3p [Saccharomyces cerevisiae YJM987]AJU42060.1 Ptp3p [Saccharomyces cerevisiae YJM990]AJU42318.1 Ptp3p [Saccharomyces cerevisiae YJM996]A